MNETIVEEPQTPAEPEPPEQPDDGDTLPDSDNDTVPEDQE